ncbi:MAG: hypothetical protein ACLTDR_04475 [Adlercreutzia equolifaciens]
MHLEHWERIFNGFGHLTSGITQELIAIVVLAVVAVVYLVLLRKSGEGTVPAWCAVVAMAVCAVLVVVCGHSCYDGRPPCCGTRCWPWARFWERRFWPISPTLVALAVLCGDDVAPLLKSVVVAAAIGSVLVVAYGAASQTAGDGAPRWDGISTRLSPTPALRIRRQPWPSRALLGVARRCGGGRGGAPGCALAAWRKPVVALPVAVVGALAAVAGAVMLRMAFYAAGLSVFPLY